MRERNLNAKTASAVCLVSVSLISFAAGIHIVQADSTDRIRFSSGVTLFSPINKTYTSRFLTLSFAFGCGLGTQSQLSYNIDGKYGGPMPFIFTNPNELHVVMDATGSVTLPELSEGSHSLTVSLYAHGLVAHKSSYSDTIYFAIDLTPPNVSVLSPVNKTYVVANITEARIPLDFAVNENVSRVSYRLDGLDDMVIAGNATLKSLSVGSHNVTVKAWDSAGYSGVSETVNFTVAEEAEFQSESEPFPTTLMLTASGASIASVGNGLLVYFKKRKH